ncbi:fluoride efflux transporter CrcB [Roseovarius sp. D22-M7]|uniref:fluoride efflux transporter CrcB n=1 Tax=Roseovarius sp. D22-M7 TaxID=3127116 RepID=UPI00301017D0
MMMTLLQVALGGAIGACLRFGVVVAMSRITGPGLPLGVLTVNVAGSFLMGVVMVLSMERDIAWLGPLVMVGILGGFTTFSTFSLEAFALFERGQVLASGAYVGLNVVLSLAGLALGVALARGALA